MPTKLIRKQFLLTKEENERLQATADTKGLSVSNLTRMLHGLEPLEAGGNRKEDTNNGKKNKVKRK